jgi:hypothetical protein
MILCLFSCFKGIHLILFAWWEFKWCKIYGSTVWQFVMLGLKRVEGFRECVVIVWNALEYFADSWYSKKIYARGSLCCAQENIAQCLCQVEFSRNCNISVNCCTHLNVKMCVITRFYTACLQGKLKLSLCLTKRHAMKMYGGVEV